MITINIQKNFSKFDLNKNKSFFNYILNIYYHKPYGLIFSFLIGLMITCVGINMSGWDKLSNWHYYSSLGIGIIFIPIILCSFFIPLQIGLERFNQTYKIYSIFRISKWEYLFAHFLVNLLVSLISTLLLLIIGGYLIPLSFHERVIFSAGAFFSYLFEMVLIYTLMFSVSIVISGLGRWITGLSLVLTATFLFFFILGFIVVEIVVLASPKDVAIIEYIVPFLGIERLNFLSLLTTLPNSYSFDLNISSIIPIGYMGYNFNWNLDWLAFVTPVLWSLLFYGLSFLIPFWKKYKTSESIDSETILELDIRSLKYFKNNEQVLNNVSLKIQEGDRIGIIGKNGIGKTTLLETLVGCSKAKVNGKINYLSKNTLNIRAVFQEFKFDPALNIRTTFKLLSKVSNLKFTENEITNIFYKYELNRQDKYKFNKISTGQKQRFKLMVALELNPHCLILDEITTALDFEWRQYILRTIFNTAQTSSSLKTIILVSHDYNELKALCNKFYLIKNGQISPVSDIDEYFQSINSMFPSFSK